MLNTMETTLVDWSRLQFAMTAAYHWLFVPLTLGLSIIVAVMESIYVKKKDEFWKKVTKFWMKLFAINFAVGVATGIILEFQFGTNWSNYSWFVGDIFGAPLAVEGIFAFFMEATFFAVMFFGWEKVSKRFHLISTWLTGIGAALSAFWILVANGWMQHPVGTEFNMEAVRNEMTSFWALVANPVAVSKFFHAVFSGWMTGAIAVIGISCWYLIKNRQKKFAYASISVACIVGLLGSGLTMLSGDSSGVHAAKYQPMKLAAAEGLRDGGEKAAFSIIPGIEIPGMLSILATHDINGYVPGINDILAGGYTNAEGKKELSAAEKMLRGQMAISSLKNYREIEDKSSFMADVYLKSFEVNKKYLGYGYIKSEEELVPNVPLVYWSFRVMVFTGSFLVLLMFVVLWLGWKRKLHDYKWLLYVALFSIPLVYLCGQAGWIVAEAGRQPWTIQDMLPVSAAVSSLSVAAVKTTFFIFVAIFTLFLAADLTIMVKAIGKGPDTVE
ncbi:MAG: cytochrome ubiquinol oxidase subunit I [Bacteroidales bacterium]|nr:cytochrome ubiquinol oxidase subunit I [Bacteroidales bacterium]